MPFWSKESRAQNVIENVAAYAAFHTQRVPLDKFKEYWLTGLQQDGLLVRVNWSGEKATGYDMWPNEVGERLLAMQK